MTDEEKVKLNNTINKLCEVLGFTTPLNIMKVAAATTDLFYDLQNENEELEKQLDCYKALESHYEEIEEDAKAIAKENAELKAHCKAVDEVNEKMKCCGNCKYDDCDDEGLPTCSLGCYFDCKSNKILPNENSEIDKWELAE